MTLERFPIRHSIENWRLNSTSDGKLDGLLKMSNRPWAVGQEDFRVALVSISKHIR